MKLNCILAPLVAALCGAAALLVGWHWQAGSLARQEDTAQLATITGLARLLASDEAGDPVSWLAAHPGWTGLARVRLDGDRLLTLQAVGACQIPSEPTDELVLSFQAARAWRDGARAVAAAPCLGRDGPASVLLGWWNPQPAPAPWPWLSLAGGVLLIGGGLGWYLVARVYRPVLWLERAALAAAEGRAEPANAVVSEETASLRSSIATLVAQRNRPHADP